MVGIYGGGVHRVVCLPWWVYRVYIGWYASHDGYPRVYIQGGMPPYVPLVYIPLCTLLGIPRWVLHTLYMLSAVGTGVRLRVDEALGSRGKNPLGESLF